MRPLPSIGGGSSRAKGLEVSTRKSRKARPTEPCTASTRDLQFQRQIVAEHRHRRAEDGEDQHPQQHRALVVAPHAGNLVDQRLGRMRILGHVEHREIRDDIGMGQRNERRCRSAAPVTVRPERRCASACGRRAEHHRAEQETGTPPRRSRASARSGRFRRSLLHSLDPVSRPNSPLASLCMWHSSRKPASLLSFECRSHSLTATRTPCTEDDMPGKLVRHR